jgi:hypothetical protein
MDGHRPEVADVFRSFAPAFLATHHATEAQRRVLRAVLACKTADLGGHKARCENCSHEEFFYNSCRNRHCPKCQGAARAKWLQDREAELLETSYFHVVFTIPEALGPIGLQNQKILYGILFRAAAETLLTIARDPRHLGAEVGFLAVLHTWGQRLDHHPHVHCVVPGGGLSPDRRQWISCRDGFFLPVRVLSRLFRGKFLAHLEGAFTAGQLKFHGKLEDLRAPSRFEGFLASLRRSEWVVYSKPPFGGPKQVLRYLARYTHRVAISNQRLVSLRDGKVTFQYKDYRCGNAERHMTLDATEFIRRFLQHVLPPSFHRLRYYGFLANSVRKKNLALARALLPPPRDVSLPPPPPDLDFATDADRYQGALICPACNQRRLVIVEELPRRASFPVLAVPATDTS